MLVDLFDHDGALHSGAVDLRATEHLATDGPRVSFSVMKDDEPEPVLCPEWAEDSAYAMSTFRLRARHMSARRELPEATVDGMSAKSVEIEHNRRHDLAVFRAATETGVHGLAAVAVDHRSSAMEQAPRAMARRRAYTVIGRLADQSRAGRVEEGANAEDPVVRHQGALQATASTRALLEGGKSLSAASAYLMALGEDEFDRSRVSLARQRAFAVHPGVMTKVLSDSEAGDAVAGKALKRIKLGEETTISVLVDVYRVRPDTILALKDAPGGAFASWNGDVKDLLDTARHVDPGHLPERAGANGRGDWADFCASLTLAKRHAEITGRPRRTVIDEIGDRWADTARDARTLKAGQNDYGDYIEAIGARVFAAELMHHGMSTFKALDKGAELAMEALKIARAPDAIRAVATYIEDGNNGQSMTARPGDRELVGFGRSPARDVVANFGLDPTNGALRKQALERLRPALPEPLRSKATAREMIATLGGKVVSIDRSRD